MAIIHRVKEITPLECGFNRFKTNRDFDVPPRRNRGRLGVGTGTVTELGDGWGRLRFRETVVFGRNAGIGGDGWGRFSRDIGGDVTGTPPLQRGAYRPLSPSPVYVHEKRRGLLYTFALAVRPLAAGVRAVLRVGLTGFDVILSLAHRSQDIHESGGPESRTSKSTFLNVPGLSI